jgi:hypothetical protein
MKSKCCHQKIKVYHNINYCQNCLRPVKVRKSFKSFTIFLFATVLVLASATVIAPGHLPSRKFVKSQDIKLEDSSVLNYMNEIGILFPEVLAQIHLESSHYRSKICRVNHNLLGIKYIHQKEAIGENLGHANYPDYKSCLRDYKRLQKYYLKNLQYKYAEDSTYTDKLAKMH